MGYVTAQIKLSNPNDASMAPILTTALVDTGALMLCIPEHIATQLKLSKRNQREVGLADGSVRIMDYVGPIEVTFQNRSCFVGGLVLGDEVLLGAVPLEDMDLIVSPATQTLEVNPKSPNLAFAKAK